MRTYIVLDLEWNQSPIGKEGAVEAIPFEIIEIGAVKLDENLEYMSEFHEFISPVVIMTYIIEYMSWYILI